MVSRDAALVLGGAELPGVLRVLVLMLVLLLKLYFCGVCVWCSLFILPCAACCLAVALKKRRRTDQPTTQNPTLAATKQKPS